MKADGVIFDLDGTLWDATENIVRSWNQVLLELGYAYKSAEEVKGCMGLPMGEIFRRLFPGAKEEERRRIAEKLYAAENAYIEKHGGILYEGLEDTLKALEGKYLLAVVSNCQAGYIEAFLEYHKLESYFDDFECFGRTGREKGRNIRMVVERNQLDRAVYVGDVQGDYYAAEEAEIPFIHAENGYGTIQAEVPSITDLEQLPQVVEEIFKEQ